jgi:membrane associated rhomboid family serine protease
MGIYDRDYYRREGPSYIGSFMERGKVCKWLVIINVVCFMLQVFSPEVSPAVQDDSGQTQFAPQQKKQILTEVFDLDAQAVSEGQVWRLLTYAFLHDVGSFMHILFNMLFLWWFGTDVEDLYGPVEFLTFYLVSAVVGALAYVAAWMAGVGSANPVIGASGAVMAVMVVCAMHYPSRVIWVFMFLPIPIWFFVLFELMRDWVTFATHARTTTAVSVHLGGGIFGFAYYELQWRLSGFFSGFKAMQRRRPRARLRVYREEVEAPAMDRGAPSGIDMNEQLEAKLDAVLDKVARLGQASLTESERQILLRASEVYKRKKT